MALCVTYCTERETWTAWTDASGVLRAKGNVRVESEGRIGEIMYRGMRICTFHKIYDLSNEQQWDHQAMWHAWEGWEIYTNFTSQSSA